MRAPVVPMDSLYTLKSFPRIHGENLGMHQMLTYGRGRGALVTQTPNDGIQKVNLSWNLKPTNLN